MLGERFVRVNPMCCRAEASVGCGSAADVDEWKFYWTEWLDAVDEG